MAVGFTNKGKHLFATGAIVPGTTDIRMGLLSTCAGLAASAAIINFVSDMEASANFAELTGASGYARVALTTVTATEVDGSNWSAVDSADVSFGALGAGGTIVGAFIYKYNAADSAAEVICIYDLTSTPTNGGTVTVTVADWARVT
jgi:hypothetical protein